MDVFPEADRPTLGVPWHVRHRFQDQFVAFAVDAYFGAGHAEYFFLGRRTAWLRPLQKSFAVARPSFADRLGVRFVMSRLFAGGTVFFTDRACEVLA